MVFLAVELHNKVYDQIAMGERVSFGQHTHGKLIGFLRLLAARTIMI